MTVENRLYLAILLIGTGASLAFGVWPAIYFATTAALSVFSVRLLKKGVDSMVAGAKAQKVSGPVAQIGMVVKVPLYCLIAYFAAKQGIPSVIAFLVGLLSVYSAFVWVVYSARPPKNQDV